jgi:hypothetical protein
MGKLSAGLWPCFQIEPAAGRQSGLRVNVLTMIVCLHLSNGNKIVTQIIFLYIQLLI